MQGDSWGRKEESDTTERLNELNRRNLQGSDVSHVKRRQGKVK